MKVQFQSNKKYLIDLTMLVNVGAIDDHKKGVSHFVEHLILSQNNEKIKALEQKNIFINGYTTQDSMVFKTSVLKKDVYFAVKAIIDVIFNSSFSDSSFVSEKNIIIEEIKSNETSKEKLGFIDFLAKISNTDVHEERGSLESVKDIEKEDVCNFYKKYLTKSNSILSFSSNVNFLTRKKIKKLLKGDKTQPTTFKEISPAVLNIEQNLGLKTSHIFFAIINDGLYKENRILYELLMIIYFSQISKFWSIVRESQNLCYYIDYENVFIKNFGFSVVQIDTDAQNISKIVDILSDCLNNYNPTKEQFEKAKMCQRIRMYEDYHANINIDANLRKILFSKKNSFKKNIQYLDNINYNEFLVFSHNVLKEYSLLIQK